MNQKIEPEQKAGVEIQSVIELLGEVPNTGDNRLMLGLAIKKLQNIQDDLMMQVIKRQDFLMDAQEETAMNPDKFCPLTKETCSEHCAWYDIAEPGQPDGPIARTTVQHTTLSPARSGCF